MAVSISIDLPATERASYNERLRWLKERIPTKEFLVNKDYPESDAYWDDPASFRIKAGIYIWSDDADRVATEYWFKFQ